MGRPTKKGIKVSRKMRSSAASAKWHEEIKKRANTRLLQTPTTVSNKYTVIANLQEGETSSSFKEALRSLFSTIKKHMSEGGISAMVLDQGGYGIKSSGPHPGFRHFAGTYFISFYAARDLGYDMGIVKDGRVID